ncbi:hypothetical protein ANRL4_05600 [Anaerolineae bacterium]|nr:hypothetical protein ANRL4_05600 [Anaerolineae bacterium]
MTEKKAKDQGSGITTNRQSGGVNAGGSVSAGGDIVGGNKVGDTDIAKGIGAGAVVTQGRAASASVNSLAQDLARWQQRLEAAIDARSGLSATEKQDLKDQVAKIQEEAVRGDKADVGRLSKLISMLAPMAEDIFEVAITTLANPLLGVGLVVKKIGDKAKVEREANSST